MKRVIFVDDSETALAATAIASEGIEGIEVKQYLRAQAALDDIAQGGVPDLIITDLNMPEMNGLEFLAELRRLDETKATPVIMLTTESDPALKEQGKALGLMGWIKKPAKPPMIQAAIKRALKLG